MARCPRCGYEWATRSKWLYVTCPRCHYNFRNSSGVLGQVRESWDRSETPGINSGLLGRNIDSWDRLEGPGKKRGVIKLQGCGDGEGACGVYEFGEEVWEELRRRARERDVGPGIEVLIVDDRVWDEVVGA